MSTCKGGDPARWTFTRHGDRLIHDIRLKTGGTALAQVGDLWIVWNLKKWRPLIYERDGHICFWCGGLLHLWRGRGAAARRRRHLHSRDADGASLDHLRPVSRGGTDSPFNIVTSCNSCNYRRLNMDWRVWAQFLGKEQAIKEAVERMQYATYLMMTDGSIPGLLMYRPVALELYRQGLHPVWGAAIDPDRAIYKEYTFVDTGLWRAPIQGRIPVQRPDWWIPPNRIRKQKAQLRRAPATDGREG